MEDLARLIERLLAILREYGLGPLVDELDLDAYEAYRREHPREDA